LVNTTRHGKGKLPFKKKLSSQVWWYTLIIPAHGKLRQEECKFEAGLGYIARLSQK
jgi:hypothetical protein